MERGRPVEPGGLLCDAATTACGLVPRRRCCRLATLLVVVLHEGLFFSHSDNREGELES